MKKKYIKELHDLQLEKNFNADMLRLAIECIFRRDYWESKEIQNPKDKKDFVNHCLLQDDLEDLESRLDYLRQQPKTQSIIYPF